MSNGEDRESRFATVLDYLPHGRPDDDRPQYQKPSLAHAVGWDTFKIVECVLADDTDISIGDRAEMDSADIEEIRDIPFDDLTAGARSEIEYAIEGIIADNEQRFVDHYNEAQPITLRLHQLNLLPGIGKKLRNNILEERKRRPFDSFEDIEERVSGLHDPQGVLVKRIQEEIREDDLKYRSFVR
jgi:putative nucleotide binding protein